jgi:hypothetical protein
MVPLGGGQGWGRVRGGVTAKSLRRFRFTLKFQNIEIGRSFNICFIFWFASGFGAAAAEARGAREQPGGAPASRGGARLAKEPRPATSPPPPRRPSHVLSISLTSCCPARLALSVWLSTSMQKCGGWGWAIWGGGPRGRRRRRGGKEGLRGPWLGCSTSTAPRSPARRPLPCTPPPPLHTHPPLHAFPAQKEAPAHHDVELLGAEPALEVRPPLALLPQRPFG